jgi:hypothetical protein
MGTGVVLDDSGLSRPQKRVVLLAKQDGKCAACRRAVRLVADHDHRTGLLRGMLCQSDNRKEGVGGSLLMSGDYPTIDAYLADPPAGCGWMWTIPDGWCRECTRLVQRAGVTVLEFVRSDQYRDHLTEHHLSIDNVIRVVAALDLPEIG